MLCLLLLNLALWALLASANPPPGPPHECPEIPAKRTYFYVGGHYENVTTKGKPVQYKIEQMYVERLEPLGPTRKIPLNWLNTPDGRQGWASYFLRDGYTVYLVDQPERGRSPWLSGTNPAVTEDPAVYTEKYFTAVEKFRKQWPQAKLHTQWPGTGQQGDPTFDAFQDSQVQYLTNTTETERVNRNAGKALLAKIGPAVLMVHSQAGLFGWGVADDNPGLVKGIVALEPEGPPFYNQIQSHSFARRYGLTDTPLHYSPPSPPAGLPLVNTTAPSANLTGCSQQAAPPRRLPNLARLPTLLLTTEASYHAPYDHCTVQFLRDAGLEDLRWLDLPAVGVRGNAHFMFVEENNLVIAGMVREWLDGKV